MRVGKQVVQELLVAGADYTARTDWTLESAFHMAAKNGNTRILHLLPEKICPPGDPLPVTKVSGSPLFYVDEKGSTLLHAAVQSHATSKVRCCALMLIKGSELELILIGWSGRLQLC